MRLLPLTTLLALACNSPTAIAPGQPFVMAVGDTVTVSGTDLSIVFRDVADSRCPSRVMCIWAGEARVTLLLRTASGSVTVDLPVPSSSRAGLWRADALEITPYPEDPTPIPRDRYRLTLRVVAAP
jgi:hypothetical protein